MSHTKVTENTPPQAELDAFRELQRLAYQAAGDVAAGLEPGVTEREAARRIRVHLEAHGVQDWFHTPFAWFGDRTAFRGFRAPPQYFPTRRALEEGMPFILDCAPVRDGCVADIGYSGYLGDNPLHDRLMDDLRAHRRLIVERVRAGDTLQDVYRAVDALIRDQGYDNRHRVYPGRVIAHRVGRVRSRLPRAVVAGFGIRSLQTLVGDLVVERAHHRSPLWADGDVSAHPATPGMWAVEPHIGFRDIGVKFEEILVVTGDDAYWLDDDLPHVRRWDGPPALIGAVRARVPADTPLFTERFAPAPIVGGAPFEVRLGHDGPVLSVPAGETALEAVRRVRPETPYSCRQGFCGTCRVRLLAGVPDHRDRPTGGSPRGEGFALCVSRAREGERLVVDL